MTSPRRRRALRSPPFPHHRSPPPPSRSYHRPTVVPRQRACNRAGVVTLTAAGVSRRVAAVDVTREANACRFVEGWIRAGWVGEGAMVGEPPRLAPLLGGVCEREKSGGEHVGRPPLSSLPPPLCRFYSPILLALLLALRSRPGDGVGSVSLEARTLPGSLEQCTLRAVQRSLLSSWFRFGATLPSSSSARREKAGGEMREVNGGSVMTDSDDKRGYDPGSNSMPSMPGVASVETRSYVWIWSWERGRAYERGRSWFLTQGSDELVVRYRCLAMYEILEFKRIYHKIFFKLKYQSDETKNTLAISFRWMEPSIF